MSYPVVQWIKQTAVMNTILNDQSPTITSDSSGNVYVAYYTGGTISGGTFTGGSNDIVVFKMDTNGNMVWIKQTAIMNNTGNDLTPAIAIDSFGNVYVSYYTTGTVSGGTFSGGNDNVVFKLDTNGNMVWIKETKLMNTITVEYNPNITVDSSGNVYVVYYTSGTVSGGTFLGGTFDVVVFKLDTNGNMVWIKETALMNTTGSDANPTIAVDSSGNVYVSYVTSTTVSGGTFRGTYDIVVFKLDTNGNMVWIKQTEFMNTTANDNYPLIAVDSSGNVYVAYQSAGTVSGGTFLGGTFDVVVFKLDTNGNMVWIKQTAIMNTTGNDLYPTIAVDSSGNVYVSYYTTGIVSGGTLSGSNDIVVFVLDTNGNMKWSIEEPIVNTVGSDLRPTIAVDAFGNVYIVYYTTNTVSGGTLLGGYDIIVFKINQSNSQIAPSVSSTTTSQYNNAWMIVKWLSKNGADSIKIYRDTQISGATKTLLGTSTSYSFTDTTIPASGTYYYFLSGVFGSTESTVSSPYIYSSPLLFLSWIKQTALMNTTGTDQNPATAVDSSGNVYVSYFTTGTVSGGTFTGGTDIVVFKMDTNGNIVWIKEKQVMNTIGNDLFPTIAVDVSGNVYVSYYTDNTVSGGTFIGSSDIVIFKLDTNGNTVWIKENQVMNTTGTDQYPTIAVDASGNVYVSYNTSGIVSGGTFLGSYDIAVFKMDTNGNIVWIKENTFMNTSGADQYSTIAVDSSGNVYVSYFTPGTVSGGTATGSNDIAVFKMDTNGNIVWIKENTFINSTLSDRYPTIAVDASGNVYVSYFTTGTVSGGTFLGISDIVIFKLDTNGNTVWIKENQVMNTTGNDQYPTIAVDASGNVYVSYYTNSTVSGGTLVGGNDIVVFVLDTNGNMKFITEQGIMNTTTNDLRPSINVDSSGNAYVSYYTNDTVSGGTLLDAGGDIVVFKLKSPSTTPSAPTALSATEGNQQLIINFTPGNNGGSAITNYQYSTDNGSTFTAFSPATGAVSSVTITGLTNGQLYRVQLKAVNAIGASAASATVTGTPASATTTPSAPTALYSLTGDQQLDIVFTPGSNGGSVITNYQYSINNGSTFTAFSPATGAVSSVTIIGLTNGQTYSIQLKAVNANGAGTASATVTGTPASATAAVADGPSGITDYISSQPVTNDAQKANTIIDIRTAIKEETFVDDAAKAASQLAYIDAMRTQIGGSSYTLPSSDFTSFLNTFTSSASGLDTKPVAIYYPAFVTQTPTIDVSAVTSASYFHTEVPVGYSVIFQNGAATLKLTNNGTTYVDDSSTVYNVNTSFVLGDKTYILLGIGSIMLNVQSNDAVVCLNEGTHILTPNGNVPIETLRQGDMIVTGTRDVKPVVNIQKIVVVRANENNAPYIIEKEAFGTNCPPNRLIVSPRHAIQLQPGLWEIPREAAKENKRVYQNKEALDRKVIYYHITLPNYESDTLVANGQITEALNDGKVAESYVWNNDKRGYVRETKPIEKKATA